MAAKWKNEAMVKSFRDNNTEAKANYIDLVKINVRHFETKIGWFVWKEKFSTNVTKKL